MQFKSPSPLRNGLPVVNHSLLAAFQPVGGLTFLLSRVATQLLPVFCSCCFIGLICAHLFIFFLFLKGLYIILTLLPACFYYLSFFCISPPFKKSSLGKGNLLSGRWHFLSFLFWEIFSYFLFIHYLLLGVIFAPFLTLPFFSLSGLISVRSCLNTS